MKIAIFASGNGSNFEAIIRYFSNTKIRNSINNIINIDFSLICNKKEAFVLKRAQNLNIKSFLVDYKDTYNFLKEHKFDLCILAGYMRILDEKTLKLSTFINIHPSLLPKYKGLNAIKRAYLNQEKEYGITIHYVNEEVDSGKIIAQEKIDFDETDNFDIIEKKIHSLEHKLYPQVIEKILKEKEKKRSYENFSIWLRSKRTRNSLEIKQNKVSC